MIRIYVPFMDRLNLNGDGANALIIQKRLKWAGFGSQIIGLSDEVDFAKALKSSKTEALFVIVGHGSRAAMDSISSFKAELVDLIDLANTTGGGGLVIGSSYEWLVPHDKGRRKSEFVIEKIDIPGLEIEVDAVGYVNSDSNLEDLLWSQNVLYTRLHGPILAKSPELADHFCGLLTSGKYIPKTPAGLDHIVAEAQAIARGERD